MKYIPFHNFLPFLARVRLKMVRNYEAGCMFDLHGYLVDVTVGCVESSGFGLLDPHPSPSLARHGGLLLQPLQHGLNQGYGNANRTIKS